MVYGFENRKSFSDFKHLILKLMYPIKARLGPYQDLPGTYPGPDRDPLETLSGPAQDPLGTSTRLARDPPKT